MKMPLEPLFGDKVAPSRFLTQEDARRQKLVGDAAHIVAETMADYYMRMGDDSAANICMDAAEGAVKRLCVDVTNLSDLLRCLEHSSFQTLRDDAFASQLKIARNQTTYVGTSDDGFNEALAIDQFQTACCSAAQIIKNRESFVRR